MEKSIFSRNVTLKDSLDGQDISKCYAECKQGIRLRDASPSMFNSLYKTAEARKLHDANFAFVMTTLSKIHTKTYEPKYNTTYAQDIPVEVGGGMVDYVDYFTVDYAGMPTEQQNLVGNNVTDIAKVNAKLNHRKVDVHTFEIAYDIKFVEIDKLNKVQFTKSLEAIYKDGITAGWDLFCDKIAYEGFNGKNGLFTHEDVITTVIPQGTKDATQFGFAAMTDEEIVSVINGILSYYLINTNNNLELLPDKILLPVSDSTELSNRFSTLYSNTLRRFLSEFNVGSDEAISAGISNYKLKINGRNRLNNAGTLNGGRIVAYKYDKDFVRIDVPYPVQSYYTGPNVNKACYTTVFIGQVSEVQLPYNESAKTIGAVTYWDLTPASGVIKYNSNGGTGSMEDQTGLVGNSITLRTNTFTKDTKHFKGWALTPTGEKVYDDGAEITLPTGTTTLYAYWSDQA